MRLSLSANSQGETAEKLQDVEKEKSIELQNEKCQTNFFFFFLETENLIIVRKE